MAEQAMWLYLLRLAAMVFGKHLAFRIGSNKRFAEAELPMHYIG